MYKTILLTLDGTSRDKAIIEHVKPLAKLAQSRVLLFHVECSGRKINHPDIPCLGTTDVIQYLRVIHAEFRSQGIRVEIQLAYGDPAMEMTEQIRQKGCDLVVINTQLRKSVTEIFFGTTAERLQDEINIPLLLFKPK